MNKLSCLLYWAVALLAVPASPAANVSINAASGLPQVDPAAFGIHTSVYDNINQYTNASQLPARLMEAGLGALRYSGGGYADVYHWSVNKLSPWQDGSYGYQGPKTDFGNFVRLLDYARAQAVITVNFGSGQLWNAAHTQLVAPSTNAEPQEAAAWVAYANGDASLYGTPNDIAIGADSLGNDWKTVGFWAKLRGSTVAQYNSWAGTSNHLTDFNFLAINHPAPVAIRYWEIGNETFGTGFFPNSDGSPSGNGYSVDYAVPYPYTTYSRTYNSALSPETYGQQVRLFSLAMKAVDPTIKIGAVVSTPPGDYSWDTNSLGQHWTPLVLAQCATNVDFVIAHWYPWVGNGTNQGSALLPVVGATIPFMINGATAGQNTGTSSGLRDWINAYRPADGSNVDIFITEFGYMGSLTNTSVQGPVNALFAADSYASWMDLGVANIDYLELNKTAFVGDSSSLTRGAVFYAVELLNQMARAGDLLLGTSSTTGDLRVHAALRADGNLGIALLNENLANSQTVNLTITNISVAANGTRFQFGAANFSSSSLIPTTPPTTNSVSGLGNAFTVSVPAYTMVVLTIPVVTNNTPPVIDPIVNQTNGVGQTLAFTISATDTDQPPQTLTFSLVSGPPNATVDPATGGFSWRPLVSQDSSTNNFAVQVSDNGAPAMSATQTFAVTVPPLTLPTVTSVTLASGQFAFQVAGDTGPDYAIQGSTNLLDWSTLFITNSATVPFLWIDPTSASLPSQFYRVKAGPPLP